MHYDFDEKGAWAGPVCILLAGLMLIWLLFEIATHGGW